VRGWRGSRGVAPASLIATLLASIAQAQDLEPRAYVNLPVGLNFLVAGYAYSQGGMSFDPSLPVDDAHLKIHTAVIAYVRSLNLWGKSGKFDVIVPYSQLSGTALVSGAPREREVDGLNDPRVRLSVNLFGAPALSMADFARYESDLVIGASVQVGVPVGQYDRTKAVNLGTNRWSIKPDIGFSKAFGAVTADLTAGVTFFSRNEDFFGGQAVEQAPIYSMQGNLSYDFGRGTWVALGATYYSGGRTTVNGVPMDNALSNSRAGLTVALPIDRAWSMKLHASSGISTRTGTGFDIVGFLLQYRWLDGM